MTYAKQVMQIMNLAGIAVNVLMLFINDYYGVGGYLMHMIGIGFFFTSFIFIKLSTVV